MGCSVSDYSREGGRFFGMLGGKHISYSSDTNFYVQIGKDNGKFSTRYTIRGSLTAAALQFEGVNIHSGYKKRLLMEDNVLMVART
jgi:hypothetical protein